MNIDITLEQFSGPLDMLLSLIERQKLPISEVSLSAVTEQYLTLIEHLEEKNPDDLADFLVVAAKLLLYKSRMLLPHFLPDDEDDGPTLEDQLRLYHAFLDASKHINSRWLSGKYALFRVEPPRKLEGFVPPFNMSLGIMEQNMIQLVSQLQPAKELPSTMIDKTVTLKHTIEKIRNMFKKGTNLSFNKILGGSQNKTEIIISFLALLELVKQRHILLKQDSQFSDILITNI